MSEETKKDELTLHEAKLKMAYDAIAALRRKGAKVKVTVSAVAKATGIARGTIHGKHPDWREVLEVIQNNKPSPRIGLAEIELTEAQQWERQLGNLHEKVKRLGESVQETRSIVDTVYDKLLTEVHKHFILAKETPREQAKKADMAQENVDLRKRIESLTTEIRLLKAEMMGAGNVVAFSKKATIDVYPLAKRANLRVQDLNSYCFDVINALDRYFEKPEFAPTLVYIMCGQFASGKSRWIKNHKPMSQGTVLYIDGTNHTADMRSLFVKRLRGLNNDCRIVCCRVFATLGECLDRNRDESRKRMQLTVPEALFQRIEETLDEVSYNEGFDAIEIVGVCE